MIDPLIQTAANHGMHELQGSNCRREQNAKRLIKARHHNQIRKLCLITLGEHIAKTAYNYAKWRVSTTKLRKMADVPLESVPKKMKKTVRIALLSILDSPIL